MDLIWKIHECQTMEELDSLRQEIAVAGMHGEIPNFGYLKAVFLKKKEELGLLREKKVRGVKR